MSQAVNIYQYYVDKTQHQHNCGRTGVPGGIRHKRNRRRHSSSKIPGGNQWFVLPKNVAIAFKISKALDRRSTIGDWSLRVISNSTKHFPICNLEDFWTRRSTFKPIHPPT